MGFIEDFNLIFNQPSKSDAEIEAEVIKFLNSTDFSNQEVKEISLRHVKKIIGVIEENKPITVFDAKVMYCMLTKLELEKMGLSQVKVNFVSRTEKDGSTGAYYSYNNDSVNFYNEDIASGGNILKPSVKGDGKGGILPYPERRLDFLAHELFKMEHELEHAEQRRKWKLANQNPQKLTSGVYLDSRQLLARTIANEKWSKYKAGNAINEDIYKNNHDQFICEIEADKRGLERVEILLKELNQTLYRVGFGKSEREKLATKTEQLANYDKITWSHSTNPNNGLVKANYKASMIIDSAMVIGQTHPELLKSIFEEYPAVALTHHPDGRKKTLQEIESEFSLKMEMANNGSLEGFNQMAEIKKLYETVVESDAVLSFERCLENAFNVSTTQEEYTTKGGLRVKGSKGSAKFVVYSARKKLQELATYIETEDIKRIEEVLKEYERKVKTALNEEAKIETSQLEQSKQAEHRNEMQLYFDKLDLFRLVGFSLHTNRDFVGVKTAEHEQVKKQNDELNQATQLLKTVFPGFVPEPVYFEFNNSGTIPIERNNTTERFVVIKSYEELRKNYTKIFAQLSPEDKIPLDTIRRAIETVYNFKVGEEGVKQLDEQLKSGELTLLTNKFSEMQKPNGLQTGKK